jgi:hypothetical protein
MHQPVESRRGYHFTRSLDDLLRLALEADWAAREEGCTAPQGNWSIYRECHRRKVVLPSIWIRSSEVPEGPMAQQQPPPQPTEPPAPETWRSRPPLL